MTDYVFVVQAKIREFVCKLTQIRAIWRLFQPKQSDPLKQGTVSQNATCDAKSDSLHCDLAP